MSKRAKRLLSLLMALVMVMSLSTPAFALGGGRDIGIGSGFGRDIGDDEVREFDPTDYEEEGEDPVDYFQGLDEESGIQVTVESPFNALPTKAEVRLQPVDPESVREAVESVVDGEANVLVAMDISFWIDGVEIEPDQPVKVKISAPELQGKQNLQVVHIPDGEDAQPETVEMIGDEDLSFALGANEVAFKADSFSVYAVIGGGETGDNARLEVIFMKGETQLDSMYVKLSDTTDAEKYEKIVYDPGVGTLEDGQLFRGWTPDASYTAETTPKDIDVIRDDIATYFDEHEVKEGDKLYVYALLYKAITVTYKDGEELSIGSTTLLAPIAQTAPVEYTVFQNYTPLDPEAHFEGWLVAEGSENIESATFQGKTLSAPPYPNGTVVTLSGDVVFTADAPEGNWLVFNSNGGTYVAPRFIRDGGKTERPTITMKRQGYTFVDWYADAALTELFVFGNEINSRTPVYAKWKAVDEASYTVLIWKQKVTGGSTPEDYDFADSMTLSGTPGDPITLTTTATSATVDGETYSWTGFTFKSYDTGKTIAPEGNTVVNVYFDRITVTLKFYTFTADSPTRYTLRNSGTYGTPMYGRFNSSGYPSNNGAYQEIFLTTTNEYAYPTDGTYSYYYSAYKYVESGQYLVTYDGNRYTLNGSWSEKTAYQTSGLYGSSLADNDYIWPTDYDWYSENYSYGNGVGGTRTTFLDAYLPSDGAATVNFYGRTVNGTIPIRFYKENADGSGYTLTNTVMGSGGSFYISDKYNGFHAYEYAVDGGSRTPVGPKDATTGYYNSGEGVSFTTSLDIYFNRDKYSILYMDGAYVDGNGNPITPAPTSQGTFKTVTGVTYGATTAAYNEGGGSYYDPTDDNLNENYVFSGWYVDDSCQHPYTFTTMPEGITVYAKWVQAQYRVFLRPNADKDPSLYWGTTDQAMNFRRSVGEQVSLPEGTRDDYVLIGWFFDEACENPINADVFVFNDGTVTDEYDKTATAYMTDNAATDDDGDNIPINKWGFLEDGDPGINKDVSRPWITRKLDLYALWGEKIPGARGIRIVYNAGAGTNPPTNDTLKYVDRAKAIAQGASTAPAGQRFLYWTVQKWNGSDWENTDVTVYPGDTFTVLKANSKAEEIAGVPQIEGNEYMSYTIQLIANYGQLEAPDDTYIKFHANNGKTGDQEEVEWHASLRINQAIDIPTQKTFYNGKIEPTDTRAVITPTGLSNDNFAFLGWAKLDMTDDMPSKDPTTLSVDDLWLKWVDPAEGETEGHYLVKSGDSWTDASNVSQVAADEKNPYQDLYAVWGSAFYVYHTGTNKVERIMLSGDSVNSDGSAKAFDLTALVDTSTFLYGGYYKTYTGVSQNFSVDSLFWKLPAAGAYTADTQMSGYASAGLVSTSNDLGTAYTGANIGEVSFDDVQTVPGNAIQPEAGAVYYIKEVPANKFLLPRLRYTYRSIDGKIGASWLFTNTDDTSYTHLGFMINNTGVSTVDPTLYEATDRYYDQVTITAENTNSSLTYVVGTAGEGQKSLFDSGKIGYMLVYYDNELYGEGSPKNGTGEAVDILKEGTAVYMFWVTPDGMIVTSTQHRTYTGIDKDGTFKTTNTSEGKVSTIDVYKAPGSGN